MRAPVFGLCPSKTESKTGSKTGSKTAYSHSWGKQDFKQAQGHSREQPGLTNAKKINPKCYQSFSNVTKVFLKSTEYHFENFGNSEIRFCTHTPSIATSTFAFSGVSITRSWASKKPRHLLRHRNCHRRSCRLPAFSNLPQRQAQK